MTGTEEIAQLTAQVTKATTVEKSAEVFVNGFQAAVDSAAQKILANGATAAQIQPLTDLGVALDSQSDALQAAILANTPAAPAP